MSPEVFPMEKFMQKIWVILLIAITSLNNSAWGGTLPSPVLIELNGREHPLNFPDAGESSLTAYAIIRGNVSSSAVINLRAPEGTRINAYISTLSGSPLSLLRKPSQFSPLKVLSENDAQRSSSTQCITFSPGETNTELPIIERTESDSPLCAIFSPEYKTAIGEALTAVYGGPWNDAQVCGFIVNNYHGGAEDCEPNNVVCQLLNSISLSSTKYQSSLFTEEIIGRRYTIRLSRDACASPKTKYVLRLDIHLPAQSKSSIGSIAIQQSFFNGSKAATIKPVSDGLFAPQPILLMSYLNTFCGQKVEIAKWSHGKIQSRQVTEAKDLIPYKNFILTRTPIGKFLKGGRATFELFNGKTNYGVCFSLERQRQKVNGY